MRLPRGFAADDGRLRSREVDDGRLRSREVWRRSGCARELGARSIAHDGARNRAHDGASGRAHDSAGGRGGSRDPNGGRRRCRRWRCRGAARQVAAVHTRAELCTRTAVHTRAELCTRIALHVAAPRRKVAAGEVPATTRPPAGEDDEDQKSERGQQHRTPRVEEQLGRWILLGSPTRRAAAAWTHRRRL